MFFLVENNPNIWSFFPKVLGGWKGLNQPGGGGIILVRSLFRVPAVGFPNAWAVETPAVRRQRDVVHFQIGGKQSNLFESLEKTPRTSLVF